MKTCLRSELGSDSICLRGRISALSARRAGPSKGECCVLCAAERQGQVKASAAKKQLKGERGKGKVRAERQGRVKASPVC
jgi:hypothetical protein